ncbi:peptidoglycan-binding protein [Streptomyces sp. NBC_00038]|uniref:peptidoglycan-binding domain-containing protein n=1 Tax=Streptomyces sp. NBC_00038 TaxID=2903615 RepID=UPI00224E43B2|nr:peptidoglycan-binding domain-containing protein [Streptomyces sp. NBC_00038]MCX5557321.1 peptidoglycan-binding protein [Streptomyces sp. NBC_00038]
MTEPNGHVCPECAAPRAPDGSPSCACTQRASDALRDARTAEAAAAEDFDPLRIRPYVELEPGDADTAVVPVSVAVPGFSDDASDGSASTMRLAAVPSGVGVPPDVPPRRGRRRRIALLAVAGAVVTVVAAAGFASGLFSYDTPSRDGALPDAVRASVPEASATSASASPSTSASSSPPAPAAPAPPPSTTPSRSPSSTASSTPSPSATPSQTPTTERATGSAEATGDEDESNDGRQTQTLRRGDEGPEVTELQLRLTQLALYVGDADGEYDNQLEESVRRYQWARGITADDLGVYGEATRTSLEAETTEP